MKLFETKLTINRTDISISAKKYICFNDFKTICLSDLHLGKAGYFSQNNLPLPVIAHQIDLDNLKEIDILYNAYTILILGDLFHSSNIYEAEELRNIIDKSKNDWILIKGNHDILDNATYLNMGFKKVFKKYIQKDFCFVHEPNENDLAKYFCICGHLHPGVILRSKGKQSFSFPCFYKTQTQLILPAFGSLTGLFFIKPIKKQTTTIAICNQRLYEI